MTAQGTTLLSVLDSINGGVLENLAPKGIAAHLWNAALKLIMENGIGEQKGGKMYFSASDRVRIAMLAAHLVQDIRKVSSKLSWQDFESFVSEIAEQYNYTAKRNVNISKPRVQIDVIASKGQFCIAIDCKHWSKVAGGAGLDEIAKKQAKRARILLQSKQGRKYDIVLPAVVTLLAGASKYAAGVPIVPISEINSFFENVEGYLVEYLLVTKKRRKGR
jgi:hypothetical protein